MKRALPTTFAACIALGLAAGAARADEYAVTKGSAVEFRAKITNGHFVAKSEALSGSVSHDSRSGALTGGEVRIDAGSFETGMPMRDRHMREKYLEVAKHPAIRLVIGGGRVDASAGAQGTVEGYLVIKGKQRPITIPITVREVSPDRLVATGSFRSNISDYGIEQPRFAMVKMEPVIEVTVTLVLTPSRRGPQRAHAASPSPAQ